MRRFLLFLVSVVGLFPALRINAQKQFTIDGVTYAVISDAECSVSAYDENMVNLTIPAEVTDDGATYTVTEIGAHASGDVHRAKVETVVIPPTVTRIGSEAFGGCLRLRSITIPESVTTLGDYVFSWCNSLATVILPASVKEIGTGLFFLKENAVSIYSLNPSAPALAGELDAPEGSGLFIPVGSLCSYMTQPFWEQMSGMVKTVNPATLAVVDSGEEMPVRFTADGLTYLVSSPAEKTCTLAGVDSELTDDVVVPATVTYDGEQYTVTNLFPGIFNATSVELPNTVTKIGAEMFSHSRLRSVKLGDNVTSIGNNAFQWCDLRAITLPETLVTIGAGAFEDCDRLTDVYIPGSVTHIGDNAFSACDRLSSVTLSESLDEIPYGLFSRTPLADIIIPASVTSIGGYAFSFTNIAEVVIPGAVTSIGDGAFDNDKELTKLDIGASVATIGMRAFNGCGKLAEIIFRGSPASIGAGAFEECRNIKIIRQLSDVPPVFEADSEFYAVYDTATLYVPAGSLEAYKSAPVWQDFANIVEFDPATLGVGQIVTDTTDNDAIYDLSGRRLGAPRTGINIIGGKKVLIRR